jgi:hypothetical protein
MSNSNKIFNVDEVTGKELVSPTQLVVGHDRCSTRHSALETTAAEAQAEAPTAKIAREVEMNAEQESAAAEQAAAFARVSQIFIYLQSGDW